MSLGRGKDESGSTSSSPVIPIGGCLTHEGIPEAKWPSGLYLWPRPSLFPWGCGGGLGSHNWGQGRGSAGRPGTKAASKPEVWCGLGWAEFCSRRGGAGQPRGLYPREILSSLPCGPGHSLELTVINQVLCVREVQHLVPLGQRLH